MPSSRLQLLHDRLHAQHHMIDRALWLLDWATLIATRQAVPMRTLLDDAPALYEAIGAFVVDAARQRAEQPTSVLDPHSFLDGLALRVKRNTDE